jgi:RNA polymerase sigma-70 factor, ECF subfamily
LSESSPELARADRFTALYDAYYHRVLGYARRRAGRDDAVDIVAETFAIAWRRLDDVPGGEQSLYWLYAAARRVLANHRRAQRRRADLISAIESEPLAASTPPPAIESRRVAPALARLHEDERELLLLVAWEGLDASAVAAVLCCSQNAARIRIHRARRRFAEALVEVDDELKRSPNARHAISAGAPTGALNLED